MPEAGRLTKLFAKLSGARLCYGKPVQVGDRTVIPVATVWAAGGYGFGRGTSEPSPGEEGANEAAGSGEGGGGGGHYRARPVGFIEVSPEGARFKRIVDPVVILGLPVVLVLLRLLLRERRKRDE